MIILVNGAYEPQLSELFLEVMNDSGSKLEKASGQPKDGRSLQCAVQTKSGEFVGKKSTSAPPLPNNLSRISPNLAHLHNFS